MSCQLFAIINYTGTKDKHEMNWIKQARKRAQLTQEDLARLLTLEGFAYSPAAISHWETGLHQPPIENSDFVAVFAKILKISVRDILIYSGYSIKSGNQNKEKEERLVSAFNRLSEMYKDVAVDWLEALAAKDDRNGAAHNGK